MREKVSGSADRQVVIGLARLAALANDSHTSVDISASSTGILRYNIAFKWFSDGLFVTRAAYGHERLIGKRVVRLAGAPVEEAYEAIRPWISHDTETWFRYKSEATLATHDVLVAAGLVRDGAALELEVEAANGEPISDRLALGGGELLEGPQFARPESPLYKRYIGQPYWFAFLPESRTLYIQYNRCVDSPLLPMQRFADSVVEFAESNPPDRLVFDIRENTGGNSFWFGILLKTLGQAYINGSFPLPPKGAFGIIGKRTFSSGSVAAADLKEAGLTLVGETSGGRVSSFGENLPIVLPYSRLVVAVSTRLVQRPGFEGPVEPALPVEFRGADYFADRDPYLEAVLATSAPLILPM